MANNEYKLSQELPVQTVLYCLSPDLIRSGQTPINSVQILITIQPDLIRNSVENLFQYHINVVQFYINQKYKKKKLY